MNCAACLHDNKPEARFCEACGSSLTRSCAECGESLSSQARFCSSCGAAVATRVTADPSHPRAVADYTPKHLADKILRSKSAIQGERKQVTVLFCDMVESTALAGTLGAESMHALLSDFFAVALAEVHRFEGTVNQFLGDGFMAIFGAPLAYEDHAARAGLAALAIQNAIAGARDAGSLPGWPDVKVRMGLNSGQVVVGAIGDDLRMDYTASGDTTHLAARLQSVAAPGEILCGAATVTAARDALVVEALSHITVKGIVESITPHRLIDALEHTGRVAERRAPFTGRAAELAELNVCVNLASQGRGGVIEIEGEPGAGKSRLMLEFQAAFPAAARIAVGQCITYGKQRPNVPIAELTRGLFGLEARPGDAPIRGAQASEPPAGDGADADYLGALMGDAQAAAGLREMDPATVRGRTIEALVDHVLQCASRELTVLIVEDLHWADPSTLEFLSAIANAIRNTRCLMVVTFRTGSEPSWSMAARLARVTLSPLGDADGRALLAQLPEAAGLSAGQRQAVLARAEGNPFFLEELVRAVAHGDVQLPGDVFDVLGARIDRLDAEDKTRLRIAAVMGRAFSLDLLEEVTASITGQRLRVERLVTLGFIEPVAARRRFQFVHALTQEVAYQTMLGNERRQLHAAVARRLCEKAAHAEDGCEEIAHHFMESHDPQLALPFLETATAKAIRNHTLDAAHGYLVDAMRLFEAETMTPERLVRCVTYLLQAFPVFHFLHRHKEYADLIERYAPAVEALNVPALSGAFLAQRGHRHWVAARFEEAQSTLERAIPLCAESGDPVNAAHAAVMLAWTLSHRGACARGEEYGLQALQFLQPVPVPLLQTFAHVAMLLCDLYRGRWRAAQRHGEQARDIGILARDDGMAAFGGAFLSYALSQSGDSAGAIVAGQAAFTIAPTDYFRGWALAFMASARCSVGQDAEALGILEYAVGLARDSGHMGGYTLIALLLAEARLPAGQHEVARAEAEVLRTHALQIGYPLVAAGALRVQAEAQLTNGQPQQALAAFICAQQEYAAIDAAHGVAQAHAGKGRALLALGDLPGARIALSAALSGFDDLGSRAAGADVSLLLDSLR